MLNEIKSRFLSGKRILVILVMLVAINANAQWVQKGNGMTTSSVYALAACNNYLFVGTPNAGIFLTTDNGDNWSPANNGISTQLIYAFAVSNSVIFAGTGAGFYISTNYGTNWVSSNTGMNQGNVTSLIVLGTNILAGTSTGGIFSSTNNGANWTPRGVSGSYIFSFCSSGTNIYAGTTHGIYKSTDNGLSWNALVNEYLTSIVWAVTSLGSKLYAGSSSLYTSTNSGTNWTLVNNTSMTGQVKAFAVSGGDLFVGFGSGVCFSSNNGANWYKKNQGFGTIYPSIGALAIVNNYIFAGTGGYSVWRRSLSEITGTQNISTETPSKYSLSQNYPNPFNSTSNLKFQIVNTEDVKLIVYDIMGKEVQTLVNERLQPGTYEPSFDGSQLTSGVYFYKLITDSFTETKKMLLIK